MKSEREKIKKKLANLHPVVRKQLDVVTQALRFIEEAAEVGPLSKEHIWMSTLAYVLLHVERCGVSHKAVKDLVNSMKLAWNHSEDFMKMFKSTSFGEFKAPNSKGSKSRPRARKLQKATSR